MKAATIGNDDAKEFKWYAARDARMRSIAAESSYGPAQQMAAVRMKMALEMCYKCKEVYLTYRKKFIALKVDAPTGVSLKKELKVLEAGWELSGYTKKESAQGITYCIPKV